MSVLNADLFSRTELDSPLPDAVPAVRGPTFKNRPSGLSVPGDGIWDLINPISWRNLNGVMVKAIVACYALRVARSIFKPATRNP